MEWESGATDAGHIGRGSEFHRRGRFFFAWRFKEGLFLKAEHSRDDHGGEYLNLRIQPGDYVVVELACVSDAILRAGQFFLQRDKILVGFQFRIRFGNCKQTCQSRTQLSFRFDGFPGRGRAGRARARVESLVQMFPSRVLRNL